MRVFDFQLKGLTRDDLMRRRNQGRTQHSVLMERSRPFGFFENSLDQIIAGCSRSSLGDRSSHESIWS